MKLPADDVKYLEVHGLIRQLMSSSYMGKYGIVSGLPFILGILCLSFTDTLHGMVVADVFTILLKDTYLKHKPEHKPITQTI